jgi:hypothetical protein
MQAPGQQSYSFLKLSIFAILAKARLDIRKYRRLKLGGGQA